MGQGHGVARRLCQGAHFGDPSIGLAPGGSGDPNNSSHSCGTSFLQVPGVQTISCRATGEDVRFTRGLARVVCPAHCERNLGAVAYGSTVHPMRSAVCMAAIVDGVMPVYGGELLLTRARGLPSYVGRNVGTAGSVAMTGEQGSAFHAYATDTIDLPASLPWEMPLGCLASFASLNMKKLGSSLAVHCRGGCSGEGQLQGTAAYTASTHVCRAAQHAGVIGNEGGHVMVSRGHGQDAYFGGTRAHGDVSSDAPRADESYTVAMPLPEVLSRTRVSPAWDRFL